MNRAAPFVILVSLALLASGQALAAPRLGTPTQAPSRHLRLLQTDEPQTQPRPRLLTEEPAPPEAWAEEAGEARVGRIAAELGLGAVSGLAGAVAGYFIGGSACFTGLTGCVAGFYIGPLLGFSLGAALGTYGAGQLLDGHGRFGGTFLGAVLGAGLGVATGYVVRDRLEAGVALGLPFGLVGALVGYELSRERRPAVMPLLSVAPRGGGLVGLAGVF